MNLKLSLKVASVIIVVTSFNCVVAMGPLTEPLNEVLCRAARNGNVMLVNQLLNAPDAPLVDCMDEDGRTPLIYASITDNNLKIAQILLAQGADVNNKGTTGSIPLIWASARGCDKIVSLLLSHNADVNSVDEHTSYSSLMYALRYPKVVLLLLDYGANINYTDIWANDTSLIMAVREGNKTIVDILLNYGAYISHKNKKNKVAFDYAMKYADAICRETYARAAQKLHFERLNFLVLKAKDVTEVTELCETTQSPARNNLAYIEGLIGYRK